MSIAASQIKSRLRCQFWFCLNSNFCKQILFTDLKTNIMSSKKVLVILSSVRDGRHADKVGNAVMNHLKGISNLEAEILGKFYIFIFPQF